MRFPISPPSCDNQKYIEAQCLSRGKVTSGFVPQRGCRGGRRMENCWVDDRTSFYSPQKQDIVYVLKADYMELVFSFPVCHQGVVLTRNEIAPSPENKKQRSRETRETDKHWSWIIIPETTMAPLFQFLLQRTGNGQRVREVFFVYIFLPFQKGGPTPSK